MEYATFKSRLATFQPPTKRSKAGWPHKSPSAESVARAGFYHKPQSTGSDNAVCYLCNRALDGWEKDDDPLEEHLKFSPDCGYAICQSVLQKEGARHESRQSGEEIEGDDEEHEVEDPTSERLVEARRKTFEIGWPHEAKRGWTCKTEKMVEAGWYFAPTEECEDFVQCSWCKLGLDGWEPKDDAFDEHYRRAPECPFFQYAGTIAPSKRSKAKKGRASKARSSNARTSNARTSRASRASRLSTQSNVSVQSEAPSITSIPDLDESIDTSTTSIVSTMSTASTATNKGKRKGGSRAKAKTTKKAKTTRSTRTKKQDAEPEPEEEQQESETQEELLTAMETQQTPEQPEPRQTSPVPSPQNSQSQEPSMSYPIINKNHSHLTSSSSDSELTPRAVQPVHKQSSPAAPAAVSPPPQPSPTRQSPQPQPITTPPSSSNIENAPPSSLPPSSRPPLSPTSSPATPGWAPIDIDLIFTHHQTPNKPLFTIGTTSDLSSPEKKMTVQEWISVIAEKAEMDLKEEGERVVGVFEGEGGRAMKVLEGIEVVG